MKSAGLVTRGTEQRKPKVTAKPLVQVQDVARAWGKRSEPILVLLKKARIVNPGDYVFTTLTGSQERRAGQLMRRTFGPSRVELREANTKRRPRLGTQRPRPTQKSKQGTRKSLEAQAGRRGADRVSRVAPAQRAKLEKLEKHIEKLKAQLAAATKARKQADERAEKAWDEAMECQAAWDRAEADKRVVTDEMASLKASDASRQADLKNIIEKLLPRLRFLRDALAITLNHAVRSPNLLKLLREIEVRNQPSGTHPIGGVRNWWTCHFSDGRSDAGRILYETGRDPTRVLIFLGADNVTKDQNIEWLRSYLRASNAEPG